MRWWCRIPPKTGQEQNVGLFGKMITNKLGGEILYQVGGQAKLLLAAAMKDAIARFTEIGNGVRQRLNGNRMPLKGCPVQGRKAEE